MSTLRVVSFCALSALSVMACGSGNNNGQSSAGAAGSGGSSASGGAAGSSVGSGGVAGSNGPDGGLPDAAPDAPDAAVIPCAAATGKGLLFCDDFESGDLSHSQNGAHWGGGSRTAVRTDIARSGSHSLRFHYQAASAGSDSDAEQRFDFGRNITEVWFEFYIYYPDGTEGIGPRFVHRTDPSGPNNDKFLRIWGDSYNASNKLGASTWLLSNGDERLGFEYSRNEHSIGEYSSGGLDPYVTNSRRARWVHVQFHARLATGPDANNGLMELWTDGTHVQAVNYNGGTGLDAYNSTGMNYWNQGYLLGWSNSGFTKDTYVFIDDVRIYDLDPGW